MFIHVHKTNYIDPRQRCFYSYILSYWVSLIGCYIEKYTRISVSEAAKRTTSKTSKGQAKYTPTDTYNLMNNFLEKQQPRDCTINTKNTLRRVHIEETRIHCHYGQICTHFFRLIGFPGSYTATQINVEITVSRSKHYRRTIYLPFSMLFARSPFRSQLFLVFLPDFFLLLMLLFSLSP